MDLRHPFDASLNASQEVDHRVLLTIWMPYTLHQTALWITLGRMCAKRRAACAQAVGTAVDYSGSDKFFLPLTRDFTLNTMWVESCLDLWLSLCLLTFVPVYKSGDPAPILPPKRVVAVGSLPPLLDVNLACYLAATTFRLMVATMPSRSFTVASCVPTALMALGSSTRRLSTEPRPEASTAAATSAGLTEPKRRPSAPALTVSVTMFACSLDRRS